MLLPSARRGPARRATHCTLYTVLHTMSACGIPTRPQPRHAHHPQTGSHTKGSRLPLDQQPLQHTSGDAIPMGHTSWLAPHSAHTSCMPAHTLQRTRCKGLGAAQTKPCPSNNKKPNLLMTTHKYTRRCYNCNEMMAEIALVAASRMTCICCRVLCWQHRPTKAHRAIQLMLPS